MDFIKYLRKQKALEEGAASTNSNDGANQTMATESPKRKYSPQPLYVVLKKARKYYNMQVDKTASDKVKCLETALKASRELYPDQLRCYMDFRQERERLVDSTRFCDACSRLGLNHDEVADHIVFEGKATVNKVLKDGLQVVGEKVHMFNYPLWTDAQNLYSSKEQPKSDNTEEDSNE